MSGMISRFVFVLVAALGMGAVGAAVETNDDWTVGAPAQAGNTPQRTESNDPWCAEHRRNNDRDDRETFCEVREFTLPAGQVTAETSNGSIRVTGERRSDILVRALVVAHARTETAARELAREITINTSGTLRATGPRFSSNREGWSVGFRIQTPQSTDVDLVSSNGSLGVTDVRGRLKLRTSNGSIRLVDVGGDVDASTSNGSVNATLSGTKWDGTALDVSTSNGSVRLEVPENYNARLVASTSNGRINLGFPVMVRGSLNRDVDTTLGAGGPTIRVRTSNGSVSIERR